MNEHPQRDLSIVTDDCCEEGSAIMESELAVLKKLRTCEEEREALLSERVALEQAARLRETFIGILGHDLRNPLMAITMAATLIKRRAEGGEKLEELADRIFKSADRMRRMIDQLLD